MKLVTLLLLALSTFAVAKSKMAYRQYAFEDKEWVESEQKIPPFPNLEDENWRPFYVNEPYKNTPMILLDSLIIAPDHSVRYLLNVKSPKGSNNLSMEGIRCTNRLNKVYAYGDTQSKRWILVQTSDWNSIRPLDSMRQRLREIFCFKGMPINSKSAMTRFKEEASK